MENRKENTYGNVIVFETADYKWGVKDLKGNVIIPAGKYGWIDGFDHGLARVRTDSHPKIDTFASKRGKFSEDFLQAVSKSMYNSSLEKWGIINEKGEEVLPLEYDSIWKFLGKDRLSTYVEKEGQRKEIFFHDLNPNVPYPSPRNYPEDRDDNNYNDSHYGEYAGSYAQDVMGYSDEDIDDVFDGDPDACWNID